MNVNYQCQNGTIAGVFEDTCKAIGINLQVGRLYYIGIMQYQVEICESSVCGVS